MQSITMLERIFGANAVVIVGTAANKFLTPQITVTVFNVPIETIVAAAVGAAASIAFSDPIASRRELFGQIFASIVLGASCSVLFAHGMGWKWAQELPGASALVAAFVIRIFMPSIIAKVKQLIADFKFSFTKKKDE